MKMRVIGTATRTNTGREARTYNPFWMTSVGKATKLTALNRVIITERPTGNHPIARPARKTSGQ